MFWLRSGCSRDGRVIAAGLEVAIRLLWLPRSEIRSEPWPGPHSQGAANPGTDRSLEPAAAALFPGYETNTPAGASSIPRLPALRCTHRSSSTGEGPIAN